MKTNLKEKLQKSLFYGISVVTLSSVGGISIVQANHDHDTDQQLTVQSHTGTNITNPTPPNTKSSAKKDIVNDQKKISKLRNQLKKTKSKKEHQKIYKEIKHNQRMLKGDQRAFTKLNKTKK